MGSSAAFAISLVHRIVIDRWTLLLHTAIADVAVVFIWQGVGSVVSLLLPYRPISLPARLKARKTWRRYGIHQASTYIAYGAAVVLHFPFVYIYVLRLLGPVSTNYLDYALVYLGFGFMYWGVGLGVAALYGRFAREELIGDMRICVATADRPWPPVKKLLSAARRRRRHHG